jgi:hypothetical protein
LVRPWPAGSEAQPGAPAAVDDDAGGVEQAVAEPFGFGPGQVSFQAQQARPGHEVLSDEDEGEPGGVDGEALRGQVAQPSRIEVRMHSNLPRAGADVPKNRMNFQAVPANETDQWRVRAGFSMYRCSRTEEAEPARRIISAAGAARVVKHGCGNTRLPPTVRV